jgi:hypothetical protein
MALGFCLREGDEDAYAIQVRVKSLQVENLRRTMQFTGAHMQVESRIHGVISYDLAEFLNEYGHPAGKTLRVEVTYNGTTYIYDEVVGEIRENEVVIELAAGKFVGERYLH